MSDDIIKITSDDFEKKEEPVRITPEETTPPVTTTGAEPLRLALADTTPAIDSASGLIRILPEDTGPSVRIGEPTLRVDELEIGGPIAPRTFHWPWQLPPERTLVESMRTLAGRMAQTLAYARTWKQHWTDSAAERKNAQIRDAQERYEQQMLNARQAHERSMADVVGELHAVEQQCGLSALAWDSEAWRDFILVKTTDVPPLTRVGVLTVQGDFGNIQCPALLPIIGSRNVIIKASGDAKQIATEIIQTLMLRLLATLPPGKVRFVLVDPVGLGSNMAGFMHLEDQMKELIGGRVWTEPNHIEEQLAELSTHMETVIQSFLRNRYESMEKYNEEAGEVAEPYRFLVVANFPVNFTDVAARRLISIASNGPRTGVYVLATVDTHQPPPHGFNLADLERNATVITHDGARFIWGDEVFQRCLFEPDRLPPREQFDHIVKTMGEAAREASKVEVPFDKFVLPEGEWWKGDSRAGIKIPIGQVGSRKIQYFELDNGMKASALVIGRVGSGKTTLLQVLLANLGMMFSPDEVQIFLVDFKQVGATDYATFTFPHVRVIANKSEREFGLSVLRGLDEQLQKRKDLFDRARADHLQAYRDKTHEVMPRILLIVDEFQEFFNADDNIHQEADQLLARLVRQGRAFGINVILASQTLAGAYSIENSTKDQIPIRIALQCSDADSRLILGDDNPAAKLLIRSGQAIYNDQNGLVEGNQQFQVFWLSSAKREAFLQRIKDWTARSGKPIPPQVVFNGDQPGDIVRNVEFQELLASSAWHERVSAVKAWLGEPIEIKPHTSAVLRRQSRSNLAIIGQQENLGVAMLLNALVSIGVQQSPENTLLHVLNLTNVDDPWHNLPKQVAERLPHTVKIGGRRDVPGVVGEIADVVNKRMTEEEVKGPSIYLMILGLQRAQDLKSSESDYMPLSYSTDPDAPPPPPKPSELFAKILRDGPEVGVHTLLWCDTFASFERAVQRRGVDDFSLRVAMQMSENDSQNWINSSAANKLGPNRALLSDEERTGTLEKFKPYGIPTLEWLNQIQARLTARMEAKR